MGPVLNKSSTYSLWSGALKVNAVEDSFNFWPVNCNSMHPKSVLNKHILEHMTWRCYERWAMLRKNCGKLNKKIFAHWKILMYTKMCYCWYSQMNAGFGSQRVLRQMCCFQFVMPCNSIYAIITTVQWFDSIYNYRLSSIPVDYANILLYEYIDYHNRAYQFIIAAIANH